MELDNGQDSHLTGLEGVQDKDPSHWYRSRCVYYVYIMDVYIIIHIYRSICVYYVYYVYIP